MCVKGSGVMDAPRRALCRKQQTGGPGWEDRLQQGRQGKPGRTEAAGRGRAPQCATVRELGRYLSTRLPWVPGDEASFKSQRDALIFLSPAGLLSFLLDYGIFF